MTTLKGATNSGDHAAYPSNAGEFAARWNALSEEAREDLLQRLVLASRDAVRCYETHHE